MAVLHTSCVLCKGALSSSWRVHRVCAEPRTPGREADNPAAAHPPPQEGAGLSQQWRQWEQWQGQWWPRWHQARGPAAIQYHEKEVRTLVFIHQSACTTSVILNSSLRYILTSKHKGVQHYFPFCCTEIQVLFCPVQGLIFSISVFQCLLIISMAFPLRI